MSGRNKWCPNCQSSQRTLDLGGYLLCQRCSKRWPKRPLTVAELDAKKEAENDRA